MDEPHRNPEPQCVGAEHQKPIFLTIHIIYVVIRFVCQSSFPVSATLAAIVMTLPSEVMLTFWQHRGKSNYLLIYHLAMCSCSTGFIKVTQQRQRRPRPRQRQRRPRLAGGFLFCVLCVVLCVVRCALCVVLCVVRCALCETFMLHS